MKALVVYGIVQEAVSVLNYKSVYEAMSKPGNPYGDGEAAKRIVDAMRPILCRKTL